LSRRLGLLLALALAAASLAGIGSYRTAAGSTARSAAGSISGGGDVLARAACSIPHRQLVRIWRGTDPERSGQIVFVPQEPNYVGTNFPHSGPWDYLQDVPLLWYGPGIVPAVGSVDRPVTIADIAPTQAELLGFDFDAPDGQALEEIPRPDTPPPLIVTLVWDAGGRSVLDAFPNDWPVLRSLIDRGVWFDHASVGSSPSITPATHATIGTGAFPIHTGQTDAEFRLGDDLVRAGELGPVLMMEPTLADLYDRAMNNEPLVGALASVTWHLNMASHGSLWGGGDRDIAVLRVPVEADNEGAEGKEWNLQGRNQPFFEFPAYVSNLPPLSAYTDAIDRQDGALDGKWRNNSIAQLEAGWATPARIPYQGRMVEDVIAREGFGDDDVPDLVFINSKAIDHVSHIFSVNSPEMRDTLAWQDEDLGRFVRFLDREVGRGRYVLVLTADHGAQYDPAVSGAFQVPPPELERDLNAAFPVSGHRSVFEAVRTSQIYLNEDVLAGSDYTAEEISRFILDYTEEQGLVEGSVPLSQVEATERVFSAAFPISMLPDLPCLPEARASNG
jgi:Type I phosphodiesterase / nucleotide pyrophosphatase